MAKTTATVASTGVTVKKSDVMDAIQDAFAAAVGKSTASIAEARKSMAVFLQEIEPDLEMALVMASTGAETHINTLRFLYGTVVLRAQRIGQKLIAQHKELVATTIMSVLRGLIAVGVTALI